MIILWIIFTLSVIISIFYIFNVIKWYNNTSRKIKMYQKFLDENELNPGCIDKNTIGESEGMAYLQDGKVTFIK